MNRAAQVYYVNRIIRSTATVAHIKIPSKPTYRDLDPGIPYFVIYLTNVRKKRESCTTESFVSIMPANEVPMLYIKDNTIF